MCYHPKHILVKNPHPTAAYPLSYIELEVPCGKCVSCLRKRKNDYAARLSREVKNASSMFFVTLTYNNSHIPIAQTFYQVDADTGEIEIGDSGVILPEGKLCSDLRSEFARIKSTYKPRYIDRCVCDKNGLPLCIDGHYYYTRFTPSLFREDFKNWLKGCRVQWNRDTGENLNFRYAWCGEYGGKRLRPHYHCIFLDLTKDQLLYMLNRWSHRDYAEHGYTYWKEVPPFNEDGTNAREIAARYIAKYVNKGKFDNDAVTLKEAQKGRLCNSKRFGTKDFTDEEVSYFRAYDLFGKYDIDTFNLSDNDGVFSRKMTSDEISLVVKEVAARSSIKYSFVKDDVLHEYEQSLPRAFRIRLFYYKDYVYEQGQEGVKLKDAKIKWCYRSSLLSRKVSDYLRDVYLSEHRAAYRAFCAKEHYSEDDSSAYFAFRESRYKDSKCLFEIMEEDSYVTSLLRTAKDNQ